MPRDSFETHSLERIPLQSSGVVRAGMPGLLPAFFRCDEPPTLLHFDALQADGQAMTNSAIRHFSFIMCSRESMRILTGTMQARKPGCLHDTRHPVWRCLHLKTDSVRIRFRSVHKVAAFSLRCGCWDRRCMTGPKIFFFLAASPRLQSPFRFEILLHTDFVIFN